MELFTNQILAGISTGAIYACMALAVDDVNSELAMLVFVGEIAPQWIIRMEPPDRLEGEGLDTPGPERRVVVAGTFGVNLHPAAQLADVFVKRWLEPAIAQATARQPMRRESVHLPDDRARVDIGRTEQFERARGATPFRECRAL